MDRNNIKSIIKKQFLENEISENDLELFTKYHLNEKLGENEKIQLIGIYNKVIKENENFISQKINIDNIDKIIMFLSISPIKSKNDLEDIIDENLFNKNLKIFKNIKEFILLYSRETEETLEMLKKEYVGIKITGILTDFSKGYNCIDNAMQQIIQEKNINHDNTIIDLTLGMKYVTVFFYKLAVENDIYAINWYTEQLLSYEKIQDKDEYRLIDKKFFKRLPFTTKLKIMIEPRKENSKIYSKINEGIENYNFSLVESMYSKVGNREMELFFKNLSKLYSFENMITLDVDNFYETLEKILEDITNKISRENIISGKIKEYLEYIYSLVYYEKDIEDLDEIEPRNFSWKNKFLKIFSIDEKNVDNKASYLFFKRSEIYYYLVIKYLKIRQKENLYSYDRFLLQISGAILRELETNKKITKEKLLENPKLLFDIDIDEDLEKIDPQKILIESVKGDFYFRNNILYIEKFQLSININEYPELSFMKNKGFKLLLELLENPDREIQGKILYGKLGKLSNDSDEVESEKIQGRFRKNLTVMKDRIKDFNENIKEIAKKDNIILPDVIIYEKSINKNIDVDLKHCIKINPEIYKIV